MMYFAYILECSDGTLYSGSTNNLEKRLYEHNNLKSGAHYTKIRRPVVLKYSEEVPDIVTARTREAEFKRWTRVRKLNFIETRASIFRRCICF
ncbi:MAG: GIY-YIG nuclease family protein [Minisyncoccia bacterium]